MQKPHPMHLVIIFRTLNEHPGIIEFDLKRLVPRLPLLEVLLLDNLPIQLQVNFFLLQNTLGNTTHIKFFSTDGQFSIGCIWKV